MLKVMKKNLKQKFIIILFGPTAVGKSSFAEKLARRIPSQIINCDIGQFNTPLTVGTAKPDWRASDIKQHLFDIIDKPEYFNVCQYRKMLLDQAKKIWQRNRLGRFGNSRLSNCLSARPVHWRDSEVRYVLRPTERPGSRCRQRYPSLGWNDKDAQ